MIASPTPAINDNEKIEFYESPHDLDETIATVKSAAQSVSVRVLQETADEQARVIQAMRSIIDAKEMRIQKLGRKIARRDKSVYKLTKQMGRAEIALSRVDWSRSEAMMPEVGTQHDEEFEIFRDESPALVDGLCTKCGENCIRLVDENQHLRDRLRGVDGLCIRLRKECGKLEAKVRGLEMDVDEMNG